jgi:hypothetical protein
VNALAEHVIETYELVVSAAVAAQRDAARSVSITPLRALLSLSADLTRDVGSVQASAARWVLRA